MQTCNGVLDRLFIADILVDQRADRLVGLLALNEFFGIGALLDVFVGDEVRAFCGRDDQLIAVETVFGQFFYGRLVNNGILSPLGCSYQLFGEIFCGKIRAVRGAERFGVGNGEKIVGRPVKLAVLVDDEVVVFRQIVKLRLGALQTARD